MKKLFLTLAILLSATICQAEPVKLTGALEKLPELKQGIAFSLVDNKLNYLSTLELAKWKGFTLEGGYAGQAESTGHKIVGVLSYNILNLEKLGVEIPLAKYVDVNVGLYFGAGNINLGNLQDSESDWGVSATLLSLKF